jgi:hypothetical protein
MKKFVILTMLLAFATASFAQQTTPNQQQTAPGQHWKDSDLYKKSKTQKIVGWSLVGVGSIGLMATLTADMDQGVASTFEQVISNGTSKPAYKSYTAYYVLSGVAIAGGIYLLAISSRNKRKAKAASVFIDMENATVLQGTAFSYQSFPVVGLKIPL